MPEIRLESRRLVLRPVVPADADALFPLIDNWNVARWLGVVPWPYTMSDMEHFLNVIAAPRASSSFPIFAVCLGGRAIGCAEWRDRNAEMEEPLHHVTELGYWLGEPYWGNGYATETISALVSYAFGASGARCILSGVFEGNDASLRVQAKLGFEAVGRTMTMCRPRSEEMPLIQTRLKRERFRPFTSHLRRASQ
jgi:RimJ/RimL family protein N-acetyltransferase